MVRWCTPFRRTTCRSVVPHNFLDLSILLFVVSIASNARAMVHPEDGNCLSIINQFGDVHESTIALRVERHCRADSAPATAPEQSI